jgi:ubiquinone/menaquinone biosynthesis C-methylase UbiE
MTEFWENGQVATRTYRQDLARLVRPGMKILHAGCGWDKNDVSRQFKDTCSVVGIDLDSRVQPLFHSEFHLGSIEAIPFPDQTFDAVFSEYVFEHLEHPLRALREIRRVLKSGGVLVVLTPNYYSYKTIAARFTPHWFHVKVGRHRYGRGHEQDMYPTLFRCNTGRAFEQLGRAAGLRMRNLKYITNGPTWFEKIPGIFGAFHLYHRALKRLSTAARLRCAIIAELTPDNSPGTN